MCGAIGVSPDSDAGDSVCEVLDLIYDYYESNGELNMSDLDSDEEEDLGAMADYIVRIFAKNGPEQSFTRDQILTMIKAELDYEYSII